MLISENKVFEVYFENHFISWKTDILFLRYNTKIFSERNIIFPSNENFIHYYALRVIIWQEIIFIVDVIFSNPRLIFSIVQFHGSNVDL